MNPLRSYDLAGENPRPMTIDEVDGLKELVNELPDNPIIIQIGAERGVSTMAMLEQRPDALILSIDLDERPEEFNHLKQGELPWQNVVRLLGRSQDIGVLLPTKIKCNLLFIDGDHRYEAVLADVRLWTSCVVLGGIIALHDYIPPPIPPQIKSRVYHVVEETLRKTHQEIMWTDRLIAFRQK